MMITNDDTSFENIADEIASLDVEAFEEQPKEDNVTDNEQITELTTEDEELAKEEVVEEEDPEPEPESNNEQPVNKELEKARKRDQQMQSLQKALDFIEDTFDRAMAPYLTLGDTARGLNDRNDPFFYSKDIHVGVRSSIYYDFVQRTIDLLLPKPKKEKKNYKEYEIEGCKVILEVVPDVYYFKDLDIKLYNYMHLPIPNPVSAYLKDMDK